MKIQSIGVNYKKFKAAFKSLRTDKNTVAALKDGTKPIIDNQKLNIYSSLQSIASNPDKENINFLLDVAANLAYGQGGNSEFASTLNKDGITPDDRENTNWSKLLEDTIQRALKDSNEPDLADEQAEFFELFGEKHNMTPIQKEILDLRQQLTDKVINEDTLSSEENLSRTARIRRNIDYFAASSEVSYEQKKKCLEKFVYLLSDDYKINPQLEDKKLQVVDEMLNDMVVKTKDGEPLTIKAVDQRQSGICAAISICRKAVAYEDKVQYMNIVMDELSSDPEMTVYDITDLDSKRTVKIKKINIDYNSALAKGYRIIDASAHNWMQNAHASADGSIQTEQYVAFDDYAYDIYNDSSWYDCLSEEAQPTKNFLKALIAEKEQLESTDKIRKENAAAVRNVNAAKKKLTKYQGSLQGLFSSTLKDIFGSSLSDEKLAALRNSIIEFYKGSSEDNEINISKQMDQSVKEKIISDYIKSQVPDITEEQSKKVDEKAKDINSIVTDFISNDNKLKKVGSCSSPYDIYVMNKRLFKAAAAHRLAVEEDVKLPDAVIRHERSLGIPPKDERAVDYLDDLLKQISSETVRKQYKKEDGTIPTEEELRLEIVSDMAKLEVLIPNELDAIVNGLFGESVNAQIIKLFENIENAVKSGNSDVLDRYSSILGIKNDKTELLKYIGKYKEKVSNNPSNAEVQDAIRVLCYEDRIMLGDLLVGSFFSAIQEGISQEALDSLIHRFGEADLSTKLQELYDRYVALRNEHTEIFNKWNIPTSRELILNKLENKNAVLSRKKLDILKARFDEIQAQTIRNSSIANSKEREKANEKLYATFTPEETRIIDLIDKSFSTMRKYNKLSYNNLNAQMKDALEKEYSYLGMLNGQFWVREEGSSGLVSNEQVRILEQMTGKPYHIESDANDAAKEIKKGNGSGILSSSVSDNEYAFHAQYIPKVTTEKFVDPVSGKTSEKDVLWTDNSWGKAEKDYFWNGRNGHLYTDYGSGYGGKNGFIIDKNYRIGVPVSELHRGKGFSQKYKEDFELFSNIILPGAPSSTYQRLYKMFSYILNMNEGETFYSQLEKQIIDGKRINPDKLMKLDDLADGQIERLSNRINKEIKSEDDYNKLADDDEIKLVFNKISAYLATDNPELKEEITGIQSQSELEEEKEAMFQEHLDGFGSILGKTAETVDILELSMMEHTEKILSEIEEKYGVKTKPASEINTLIFPTDEEFESLSGSLNDLEVFILNKIAIVAANLFDNQDAAVYFIENAQKNISDIIDENVRINSLDSYILNSKPLSTEFIDAIDKYLAPKSDEELLELIKQMQNSSTEKIQPFFEALTEEDVGLRYKPAYDYLYKFQMGSSDVSKAFRDVFASKFIADNMRTSGENTTISTPDEYFRALYIKLADMDVQKFIKIYKNEAFEKYKIRQAFPEPVVLPDYAIEETVQKMFVPIEESVLTIKSNEVILNILDSFDDLIKKYSKSPVFKELLAGNKISIADNEDFLNNFYSALADLGALLTEDESLGALQKPIEKLMSDIESENGFLGGKRTAGYLKEILSVKDDWKQSGLTSQKFADQKRLEIKGLNAAMQIIAKTNIEPKYRNDAISKLKNYVDLYRKGADEEAIEEAYNDFKGFMIERHITKNPTALLNETIKVLQDGKQGTQEYEILKHYLLMTLNIAQQTKVQYQLVQNQHEGISSKTSDLLKLFNIRMMDGTQQSMDSEQGMLYLVNQLQNVSDNYVTLNLFLSQSGLARRALTAIINNFDVDKTYKHFDEIVDCVLKYSKDLSLLNELTAKFFNENRAKFSTIESGLKAYTEYIKENTKDKEDSTVLHNFMNLFNNIEISEKLESVSNSFIDDILTNIINDSLQVVADSINSQITGIEDMNKLFQEQIKLVNAIKVPEDSEEQKQREKFLQEYSQCQAYILDGMNKLSLQIKNYNLA